MVSPEEREQITYLAQKLRRSQSDTIRFVVFQAATKFKAEDEIANRSNIGKLPGLLITSGEHR
jgi:hypothetical protein